MYNQKNYMLYVISDAIYIIMHLALCVNSILNLQDVQSSWENFVWYINQGLFVSSGSKLGDFSDS